MAIRVVTDSASDLPAEIAAAHEIVVVPLDVRLGDHDVQSLRDATPEEFWQLAAQETALPETSAPSPGAFVEAFEAAAAQGCEGVVCITISSDLSATYDAAVSAAREAEDRIPVTVIDSRTATMGEGLIVLTAASTARGGGDLGAVSEAARNAIGKVSVYGTLDTLDNLRRGGRIGAAQALVGSLLSIKPVIEVRNGVVEPESRQRTRARSLAYLVDKTRAEGPILRIAVVHAAARDLEDFLAALEQVPHEEDTIVTFIGPVIGTHTGLGTVGVCVQRA